MMTFFLIAMIVILCVFCGLIIHLKLTTVVRSGIPPLQNIPLPPCKPNEHDFVPNGYDHFSDYFKCRKCGAEKREHF